MLRVITDHSAVKSIFETPNPTGKHARWWTQVFGSDVKSVTIVYHAGRENTKADALSRSPSGPPPAVGIAEGEAQVASVDTEDIANLLQANPTVGVTVNFSSKQHRDPELNMIIEFLQHGKLPDNPICAKKIALQEPQFSLINYVLYYIDHQHKYRKRVAVPAHLRERLLREAHGGTHGGDFSSHKLYNSLLRQWWWRGMYTDVLAFCKHCPDCAVVTG